jgi:hypothetical protein
VAIKPNKRSIYITAYPVHLVLGKLQEVAVKKSMLHMLCNSVKPAVEDFTKERHQHLPELNEVHLVCNYLLQ